MVEKVDIFEEGSDCVLLEVGVWMLNPRGFDVRCINTIVCEQGRK